MLDRPIKAIGVHEVKIALHPEVAVMVKVNVARSPEEADLQAQGVDVLQQMFEEEAAPIAAEALEPIGERRSRGAPAEERLRLRKLPRRPPRAKASRPKLLRVTRREIRPLVARRAAFFVAPSRSSQSSFGPSERLPGHSCLTVGASGVM